MVKLLVIADDFTGALDTGIQFEKRGICTQIFTKYKLEADEIKKDTEVLVVDTESRPMSARQAYQVVKEVVLWAADQGIKIVFKKTDSALRGNIGAELQAASDAMPKETLFFLPAYPEIERITKDGTQYIQGELLENSVFGKDPFEPVKKSYIPDIVKEQSDIHVTCLGNQESAAQNLFTQSGIVVCDTTTQEDMDQRLNELVQMKRLKLLAGCAALADHLVNKISFTRQEKKTFSRTEGIYVACGSLNKITREQVEYAEVKCSFNRRHLTMEQKLGTNYYKSKKGREFLEELLILCKTQKKVIVDTFDMEEDKTEFLGKHQIDQEDVRLLIAQAHGEIVKEIVNQKMDITILMTGGDTLMGYMNLIGCTQIEPLCEIEQGVVVSLLEWNGCRQQVISKSGGFGTPDILCRIAQKILK